MKKSLVARGFVGAVASLLGVAAVGCGADVGDGAAGDSAEIGSTSEALTLSGNGNGSLQFFGSIKLDSIFKNSNGNADNLELIAGGIDASNNTPVAKIQVYDRQTDTLTPLRNAGNTADVDLPTALVEPAIAKIPGETDVYLIAAGRTMNDSTTSALSFILTISRDVNNKIASAKIKKIADTGTTGTALPSGRVFTHKSIKQCGDAANKQLIAFGGTTSASGWQSMAGLSASKEIMVLNYVATNDGGDSDWVALKDGNNKTVVLRADRGYEEVLNKTNTEFFPAGGLNNGANALATVDFVKVSSSCVADVNQVETVDANTVQVKAATAMPGALARFASIRLQPFTISSVDYDFMVGGGNSTTIADLTPLPTATYAFDPDGTTTSGGVTTQGKWTTTGTSIQEGRVFSRFVAANQSGATVGLDGINLPTVVKLVTGIMPHLDLEATDEYYQTSRVNDVFTGSTAAWTTGTALASGKDRVGVFADLLKNNATLDAVVGLGAKHTATTGAPQVAATAMQADVVSVP